MFIRFYGFEQWKEILIDGNPINLTPKNEYKKTKNLKKSF